MDYIPIIENSSLPGKIAPHDPAIHEAELRILP
jgi:hypothetical protein